MQIIKGHYQLAVIACLVFALWSTPIVLPLKLLVVFLHELSHASAALLTGGSVISMDISALQGGEAVTRGGNGFLIISAGYLGSLGFGTALFLAARWTAADRAIMALLGAVMLAVTVLYMRQVIALGFGLGTGLAMLAMARYLGHRANDLALRVIGLTSMIYVPYDIFSDTISRAHLRSDARILAEYLGGQTLFWGVLWLVLSLAVIGLSLRYGLGADSNIQRRGESGDLGT